MTRTEAALALAGGAIGGAAAIGGMWIGRRLLVRPIVAAKPYSPVDAKVTSITNLKGARP
jgi:hypothetical protein